MSWAKSKVRWHDVIVVLILLLVILVPAILNIGFIESPIINFLFGGWHLALFWLITVGLLNHLEKRLLSSAWYHETWLFKVVGKSNNE